MYARATVVLQITLILLPILVLSCTDYPISVSNITNCVDGQCFYPQLAVSSMDITDGQEACMSFSSSTNTTDKFDITITVLESLSTYATTDCYFTDDPIFAVSILCNCPLGGNSPASCPSPALDTPFTNNQFCTVGTAPAIGCAFGRTADYSAKIGVSALPRYRVCAVIKQPIVSITFSVHDSKHNDTEMFQLTTQNAFFQEPLGLYNISVTNINVNANFPGDYQVLDTSTNSLYYLGSDQCNSKFEDNPYKFGAIKINNDTTLSITTRVKQSVSVQVTSCVSDTAYAINPIPPLLNTNTKVHARAADDLPTLRQGLIWFNLLGELNYIGIGDNYEPLVGAPYHVFYPGFVNFYNGSSTHKAFPGNSTPPYWNSTECTCYSIDSFTVGFLNSPWKHGWISCPTVSFPVLVNEFVDPNFGFQAACIGDNEVLAGSCPSDLVAPVYPDRYAPRNLCMSTDNWFIDLSQIALQRRDVDDQIVFPNYQASAIITLYYTAYSVSFETTTLTPIITDVHLNDIEKVWTIKAKTLKNKGNCYIYSKPPLFDQSQIQLSQVLSDFEIQSYDISYSGDVLIALECGYSRTNKTVRIDLNSHSTISKPVQFISNLVGKSWFPYTTVSISIAVMTLVVFILYKVYKRFSTKRPKVMSYEEFMKRKSN